APVRNAVYRQQSNPAVLVWNVDGNPYATARFKLTDRSLASLRGAGVPGVVLQKLEVLKEKEFATQEEFLGELEKVLAPAELKQFRPLVLNHASELEYPHVLSTYRLTEHHLSGVMSPWLPRLPELLPEVVLQVS